MGQGWPGHRQRLSFAQVLRRKGRVVKVLARGMTDYRPTAEERELLATGRMLVIIVCPPEVRRTTCETVLVRNRLVLVRISPHHDRRFTVSMID